MNKFLSVAGIILLLVIVYLVLTAAMPTITTITVDTGNASGMSDYPETQAAIRSAPIWIYFLPGVIGIAAIVVMLKKK
ncbi:MAG: hypothetical protein KKA31_06725 [Candidatus Margulisbacteria bacterium]|nr:hypothetical protein [Candidatus Margulisiibacteriota bacterium]